LKNLLGLFLGYGLGLFFLGSQYASLSLAILVFILFRILFESNNIFVFREWTLFLYCMNYLVAPSITYSQPSTLIIYGMKIPADQYYGLALPGFISFAIGMYMIPTKIFYLQTKKIVLGAVLNKKLLIWVTIITLIFKFISNIVASELSFIFYLSSELRFVSAFALLLIDRKLWYWTVIVLLQELASAFLSGMYHGALMWLIFFGIYFFYIYKPSVRLKIIGLIAIASFILFVQAIKVAYRSEVWSGNKDANFETVFEVGIEQSNSESVIGEENLLATLNRGNQAWIFASAVERMDRYKDFQGLTIVSKYAEAALLPRFLAPNKITSGDKEIFNQFSGHRINENTSMGLGIFADGYIAYGSWGVYVFGFALGLIFALTFKLVERWSNISPIYVLLILPLLNYAVRPDCELQTIVNHLSKGILLYGFLVFLTRKSFTLDSVENRRILLHLNFTNNK
jgi:hypothetical protein